MIPGRTKNFIGQDGMFFFFGIVESRDDPEGEGRVQVRCFGIHTPDTTLLPTEDLPWSLVSNSVSSSDDPNDLVEGDLVWGFFVDGQEMQEPLVCGCIQSKAGGNKNPQFGFADRGNNLERRPRKPAGYDPESGAKPGEPVNYSAGTFTSSLNAYAGSGETLADSAKAALSVSSIPLPGGKELSEPANPAKRTFPYVKSKESESGHVLEFDDTPGAERVQIFHRAGSFIEVHPNGTVVKKNITAGYEITLGDSIVYAQGNHNLSTAGNWSQFVGGQYTLEISGGDLTIDVKSGNLNLNVNGNVNQKVAGNVVNKISGSASIEASGSVNIKGSNINLN